MNLVNNLPQTKFYVVLAALSLIPFVNISHIHALTKGGIEIDELDNIPGINIFKNPHGDKGGHGSSTTLEVTKRAGAPVLVLPGETDTATASCNSGEKLTGGGYDLEFKEPGDDQIIYKDSPNSGNTVWEVTAYYNGSIERGNNLIAYALCSQLT
jgi:hypothetical protein